MKQIIILAIVLFTGLMFILSDISIKLKPFEIRLYYWKEALCIIGIIFLSIVLYGLGYSNGSSKGAKQAIELMNEINELEKQSNGSKRL